MECKQPEARHKAASQLLKLIGLSCPIRSECARGASRYSDNGPILFPVMPVADTETGSVMLPADRARLLRQKNRWHAGNILKLSIDISTGNLFLPKGVRSTKNLRSANYGWFLTGP